MSLLRIFRRGIVVLLVAAFLAPGSIPLVQAGAPQGKCHVQNHGCRHVPSLSCCSGDEAPSPATPAQRNEASSSGIDPVKLAGPAPAVVVAAFSAPQSASELRVYSPPHGHQSSDLQALYATFLI